MPDRRTQPGEAVAAFEGRLRDEHADEPVYVELDEDVVDGRQQMTAFAGEDAARLDGARRQTLEDEEEEFAHEGTVVDARLRLEANLEVAVQDGERYVVVEFDEVLEQRLRVTVDFDYVSFVVVEAAGTGTGVVA